MSGPADPQRGTRDTNDTMTSKKKQLETEPVTETTLRLSLHHKTYKILLMKYYTDSWDKIIFIRHESQLTLHQGWGEKEHVVLQGAAEACSYFSLGGFIIMGSHTGEPNFPHTHPLRPLCFSGLELRLGAQRAETRPAARKQAKVYFAQHETRFSEIIVHVSSNDSKKRRCC